MPKNQRDVEHDHLNIRKSTFLNKFGVFLSFIYRYYEGKKGEVFEFSYSLR